MAHDNIIVGFVGLGTIGGRMATNLQKAGYKLVLHDLHRQAASHHLNAGAIWAETPRALASQADVIFSSLPEPADVEAVALGPDGLVAGIKPGAAYFDLSTNAPSVVKKINAAFAEKNSNSATFAAPGTSRLRRRAASSDSARASVASPADSRMAQRSMATSGIGVPSWS